jgi:hypothetical protein
VSTLVFAATAKSNSGLLSGLLFPLLIALVLIVLGVRWMIDHRHSGQENAAPPRNVSGTSAARTPSPVNAPTQDLKRVSTEAKVAAAFGTVSAAWKLMMIVFVGFCIWAYVWGGSVQAHLYCTAHDYGAPGLKGFFACMVAH